MIGIVNVENGVSVAVNGTESGSAASVASVVSGVDRVHERGEDAPGHASVRGHWGQPWMRLPPGAGKGKELKEKQSHAKEAENATGTENARGGAGAGRGGGTGREGRELREVRRAQAV